MKNAHLYPKKKNGLLIAFEGGEAAGKSTQVRSLSNWMKKNGIVHRVTQEPGGTPIGIQIRRLLLNRSFSSADPLTELLLYEAARAQHVSQVIFPALQRGECVITDRFVHSSIVYQGMARGLKISLVEQLNRLATHGVSPDLVVLLDLSIKTQKHRILSRERHQKHLNNRFERENENFHHKVRLGFLRLAKQNPKQFFVIEEGLSKKQISERIQEKIAILLNKKNNPRIR